MPRPKKVGTPEDMKRNVERYIAERIEKDQLPTFAGMLKYLGISKRTYYRLIDDDNGDETLSEEDRHAYRKIFEEAQLVREDWLETTMVADGKRANGCMNSLKQPQNGGFKDRIEQNIDAKLTVNVIGVGGESAFK